MYRNQPIKFKSSLDGKVWDLIALTDNYALLHKGPELLVETLPRLQLYTLLNTKKQDKVVLR